MHKKPLHIAFLVRAFVPGGAENMVLNLVRHLQQNEGISGVKCTLLIMQPGLSALAPQLPQHSYRIFKVWHPLFFIGLLQLYRWFRQERPGIIHAHLPFSGIMSRLLGVVASPQSQTIYTEHSIVRRRPDFWLHGWFYSRHQFIHFISNQVQASVVSRRSGPYYNLKSAAVIPNAVPLQPNYRNALGGGEKRERLTMGTLCVWRRVKNIPLMIELFAGLEQRFPGQLRFVIGGDGPDRNRVEAAIRRTGRQGIIELPGMVADSASFLATLDVFVMTSQYEGLPLALLEAMQQGCLPALMHNGSTDHWPVQNFGLHFVPGHTEVLGTFIAKLLAIGPAGREDLHRLSRQFVLDYYHPDAHFEALLAMYHQVAGSMEAR